MTGSDMLDRLPDDPAWGHARIAGSGGVVLHYVRLGQRQPVLLLHGWPGFWYDWRRVLVLLSGIADVIAPDFRGFGDSDKPDVLPADGYTAEILAEDLIALLDGLGISQVVVAAYDIGATVAQTLALHRPERVRALALFNPAYPGIGERRFEPSAQREFWYQHFHALAWSDRLIAHDRETVRRYLAQLLRPLVWSEGAVKASIAYYPGRAYVSTIASSSRSRTASRARAAGRQAQAAPTSGDTRIRQPTVITWGELDPVIPAAWADRLGDTFPEHELSLLPGIGHFVPIEAPERTIESIRRALALAERAQTAGEAET